MVAQLMMMRLVCILLIVSLGQVPTVRISREAREIHGGRPDCLPAVSLARNRRCGAVDHK